MYAPSPMVRGARRIVSEPMNAPAARLLVYPGTGRDLVPALADGITALAPGVLGYGLFALLSRALYARSETRLAGTATAIGWVTVIAVALLARRNSSL